MVRLRHGHRGIGKRLEQDIIARRACIRCTRRADSAMIARHACIASKTDECDGIGWGRAMTRRAKGA